MTTDLNPKALEAAAGAARNSDGSPVIDDIDAALIVSSYLNALPQPEGDDERMTGREVALRQALTAKDAEIARLKELRWAEQERAEAYRHHRDKYFARAEAAQARIAELEAERDWLRAENERLRAALNKLSNNHCADCRETARAALIPAPEGEDHE